MEDPPYMWDFRISWFGLVVPFFLFRFLFRTCVSGHFAVPFCSLWSFQPWCIWRKAMSVLSSSLAHRHCQDVMNTKLTPTRLLNVPFTRIETLFGIDAFNTGHTESMPPVWALKTFPWILDFTTNCVRPTPPQPLRSIDHVCKFMESELHPAAIIQNERHHVWRSTRRHQHDQLLPLGFSPLPSLDAKACSQNCVFANF